MEQYFHRELLAPLKKWIDRREIYAIKGPRQSGKTTILKMLQEWLVNHKKVKPENIVFLTFEDREILEKFSIDPKGFIRSFIRGKGLSQERFYFLVDEFHYLVDGGQKLKLLYDIFENIKFIITGSSSLELAGKTSKFLVGRVFSFYLWQLSFREFINVESQQLSDIYRERAKLVKDFIFEGKDFTIPKTDIFGKDLEKEFEEYAIWGGYPEIAKAKEKDTKRIILKNIFDTYVSRDIIELLKVTDFPKLRTIIGLLAAQTGNLINYNSLSSNAHTYFKDIKHWLSILEETFIISLLRPFFTNKTSELKKNPKVYFVDTGIRNYILNNFNELSYRTDMGQLIENVAFSQLKVNQEDKFSIKYWRTLSKAEVDFILEINKDLVPIEVKYSAIEFPRISRSFRSFLSTYHPRRALVLTKRFWGESKVGKSIIKFAPIWYL